MNSSRRCVFLVLSALAVTTCVALLIAGRVTAEEPDACTCSVTGRINLDDSCTSTRLEV